MQVFFIEGKQVVQYGVGAYVYFYLLVCVVGFHVLSMIVMIKKLYAQVVKELKHILHHDMGVDLI